MGILERFTDIIKANINDLLDRAEDPAKMIDQYLRDLTENLAEVKKETAGVMAQESGAWWRIIGSRPKNTTVWRARRCRLEMRATRACSSPKSSGLLKRPPRCRRPMTPRTKTHRRCARCTISWSRTLAR